MSLRCCLHDLLVQIKGMAVTIGTAPHIECHAYGRLIKDDTVISLTGVKGSIEKGMLVKGTGIARETRITKTVFSTTDLIAIGLSHPVKLSANSVKLTFH